MKMSWMLLTAMVLAGGSVLAREVSGTMETPIGSAGVDAALKSVVADLQSDCRKTEPDTTAYLERVFAGPIKSAVDDGLTIHFRCVADTDARLDEAGRNAARADAGKGIVEVAAAVDTRGPFGWDMTYGSAFDAAGVPRNDTMRKLFRDAWLKPPYVKANLDPQLLAGLGDAEVAVFIDYQVRVPIYGGHMAVVCTARSGTGEVRSVGRGGRVKIHSVAWQTIDELARTLLTVAPSMPKDAPRPYEGPVAPGVFVDAGYIGVASVSVDGQSRQLLITPEDLSDGGANGSARSDVSRALGKMLSSLR